MFPDIVDGNVSIGDAIAQGQSLPQKEGKFANSDASHKTTAPHVRFKQDGVRRDGKLIEADDYFIAKHLRELRQSRQRPSSNAYSVFPDNDESRQPIRSVPSRKSCASNSSRASGVIPGMFPTSVIVLAPAETTTVASSCCM